MRELSWFFSSLLEQLVWKISPSVISWISGLLGDILTANQKYPVREYDNFWTPVQTQLSLKLRIFSDVLVPFLETTLNFEHLQKNVIVIPTLFRKLQTVNDLVRPLSKKHRSGTTFKSEHVKGSETLEKSSWEHFYHIFHQSETTYLGICLN